jgi:L-asparaginase II
VAVRRFGRHAGFRVACCHQGFLMRPVYLNLSQVVANY